jgi:hypothetical protein
VLTDYYILEQHFNWVCDGGIRKTVERKMVNELQIMEQYLLHQGKEAVTNIITTYANDCNHSLMSRDPHTAGLASCELARNTGVLFLKTLSSGQNSRESTAIAPS